MREAFADLIPFSGKEGEPKATPPAPQNSFEQVYAASAKYACEKLFSLQTQTPTQTNAVESMIHQFGELQF